jgi:arylsulfatase A-like enzyme
MRFTGAISRSLCLGLILAVAVSAEAAAPNLLFILVDDQRNDTLGCAGHPVIKTPNVDRLASQGVRFQNAFVTTPICMASRASIFTGLTETGHGYTGGGPPATPVIPQDVDTSFPVLLKKAGYRTGYFGKQHVKFEEGNIASLNRMFDVHEVIGRNPYFKQQPDGSLRHEADLIGDRSVDFLAAQPNDKPFCLYMSFNIAHAEDSDHRPGIGHFPWPQSVDGMYEDIDPAAPRFADDHYYDSHPQFLKNSLNRVRWHWRWDTPEKYAINMRAYYRMLTGMDKVVGRVTQKLEELGLADNTVVIYTADNGYYMGDRGFAGKWSHYEESLRVPLIIYDPRLPQGQRARVVDPMALNIDLPATMLDLAGITIPDKFQGRSIVPILRGESPANWRTDFFCEHRYNYEALPKWFGVRGSRYTYASYYDQTPAYEYLFDLETDPHQLNNLATDPKHQDTLNTLRDRSAFFTRQYTRPEIVAAKQAQAQSIPQSAK